jgi:membrane fusion protein, multidrug efflux system
MSGETNVSKEENTSPTNSTTRIPKRKLGSTVANSRQALFRKIILCLLPIIAVALLIYFFIPKKDKSKRNDKVAPVSVAVAQQKAVPIEIRTTGNVQAYSVVNVLPQVGGQLIKECFTQGDFVKKGQLLFEIDPGPFKAIYDQAMGNVSRDKAQIKAAEATLDKDQAQLGSYKANLDRDMGQLGFSKIEKLRYLTLMDQGAVSKEQSDQMNTNETSANATVKSDTEQIKNGEAVVEVDRAQIATAKGTLEVDQASARSAKISLGWCTICSPMDGRTSTLNVYQGNIVTANSTQMPLVTIAQVQPIYISFSVPEEYLSTVRRCLNAGTLKVKALIEGLRSDTVLGNASFLEYTVNTTSGTALLRATFPNTDMRLYPGQFVDVIVTMPPDGKSIVVPANAVQTTQQGNSVYVVQSDNTVNLVRVDLKRTYGDWAAIAKGISNGDVVVTDGQLALTPGAKVKIIKSETKAQHMAGPATGSLSAGTPMNNMGNDESDFPLEPDAKSGALSAQDKIDNQPITGNYGPNDTLSPKDTPLTPRGSQYGGRRGHRHGFAFGAEHGGAPLPTDDHGAAANSNTVESRHTNGNDSAESQP